MLKYSYFKKLNHIYIYSFPKYFASRQEYKGSSSEDIDKQRGLNYEFHCINVLRQFSFYTVHKGIAGDKGIDFQGFWQVVSADKFDHTSKDPHMFNIIGECKHGRNLCRSLYIKELEGVLSRWKHKQHHGSFITNKYPERMQYATKIIPIIGVIVNSCGYSQKALDIFEKSHNPMIISVIRTSNWLPDKISTEHLKSCLVYWKPNKVAKDILYKMTYKTVKSHDTIVDSVRLYYNNEDVSSFTLPKE